MADVKHTKEICTVLFLCVLWYAVSSTNNVIGKMLLNEFPYPVTMTMVQLLSITILSGPFFNLWGVRKYVDISWPYYFRLIVPLALGKFIASVFSHVSIWKVPVSYAHTVKATMPLFTVILSRIIMGEKQTMTVYFSLIPIIVGVGIATLTELSFDVIGLVSALVATAGFSLQHIFSKKVLHDTGVHHLRLLHILGRLALFMFLPVWAYLDVYSLLNDNFVTYHDYRVIALLITDGTLNWLQNIIAFSVLSLVTPLTYAVANASKRIFVIAVSLFILGNPAKYDQKQREKKQTVLPYSHQSWQERNTLLYPNANGYANGDYSKFSNGHANGFVNHSNNNVFSPKVTKGTFCFPKLKWP
ncbi:hypothetical protein NQ318_008049 [Aromia moschata]|uniref:Sugar phosphate transporter domain-containing protein n=1 Tax=Aromia moschata TaxID=1265417 RepID=A0AAV8X498_9CUCU|nr:hypothetical protein NQ318_008049 [Aromia moschata]